MSFFNSHLLFSK